MEIHIVQMDTRPHINTTVDPNHQELERDSRIRPTEQSDHKVPEALVPSLCGALVPLPHRALQRPELLPDP